MRGVYVLCFLAACGSPRPQMGGDGGLLGTDAEVLDGAVTDASIDASIDAPPDAAPCPSADDHDGDGICDAVDVCPDIADPGQADLDGDGIGWMCDPVESVTLDAPGVGGLAQSAFHDDTFAARTKLACPDYNMCGHVLLQVSAAGKMIVRSDSTSAVDAWQAAPAVPWMDGPFITPQDRVLWSRGYEMGETGDFDLATRQYTSRANGVISDPPSNKSSVVSDGALVAASLGTASLIANLDDVQSDGTLSTVATAQSFGFEQAAISVPGPVPRALVPVRENFTTALRLYTQGAPSLIDILVGSTPLTNLGLLQTVMVDGSPRAFCAERGNQVIVIDWDRTNTISTHILPLPTCLQLGGTSRGDVRFYYYGSPPGVAYIYGDQVYSLPTTSFATITGSAPPLLVSDITDVWLIASDGSNRLVATGFDDSISSMSGDTINVFAHHEYPGHTDGYGTYDLIRIRGTAAPVQVTILDNVVNGIGPTLVTTVEGAALLGGNGLQTYVVPSNTMTPIVSPFAEMRGGIRDGHTIVYGKTNLSAGTVYLYDEATGSPRFTALDTVGASLQGGLIDSTAPTSWFAYSNLAVGCRIARLTAAGTLDSTACSGSANPTVLGTRADGAIAVADDSHVFVLANTGAAVVNARRADRPILDTSASPPVLVGWAGSAGAQQAFACLAMHPERCWSYAVSTFYKTTTVASAAGDGKFALILELSQAVDKVTVEIVRSIGPGSYTP